MNWFKNTRKNKTKKLNKMESQGTTAKRKKYVLIKPTTEHVAKATHSFYSDLAKTHNGNQIRFR